MLEVFGSETCEVFLAGDLHQALDKTRTGRFFCLVQDSTPTTNRFHSLWLNSDREALDVGYLSSPTRSNS
jgi:hypothetical protein